MSEEEAYPNIVKDRLGTWILPNVLLTMLEKARSSLMPKTYTSGKVVHLNNGFIFPNLK